MSEKPLQLKYLLAACLKLKKTHNRAGLIGELGIANDNFAVFIQPEMWDAQQRGVVQTVFQHLRDGMAQNLGYPPFQVPAEYIVALIYMFVSSANHHAACGWISQHSVPASDLAMGEFGSSEPLTARQLFSLLIMCESECPQFEHLFNSKVSKEQEKAAKKNAR